MTGPVGNYAAMSLEIVANMWLIYFSNGSKSRVLNKHNYLLYFNNIPGYSTAIILSVSLPEDGCNGVLKLVLANHVLGAQT